MTFKPSAFLRLYACALSSRGQALSNHGIVVGMYSYAPRDRQVGDAVRPQIKFVDRGDQISLGSFDRIIRRNRHATRPVGDKHINSDKQIRPFAADQLIAGQRRDPLSERRDRRGTCHIAKVGRMLAAVLVKATLRVTSDPIRRCRNVQQGSDSLSLPCRCFSTWQECDPKRGNDRPCASNCRPCFPVKPLCQVSRSYPPPDLGRRLKHRSSLLLAPLYDN